MRRSPDECRPFLEERRPRGQTDVHRRESVGRESIATHGFDHLIRICEIEKTRPLRQHRSLLDVVAGVEESITRYVCHERAFTAETVDGTKLQRAAGKVDGTLHRTHVEV